MGNRCRTYVMIGAMFNYEAVQAALGGDDIYEKLESLINVLDGDLKGDTFGCIYDGMNGEYVAVGNVIAAGDDDEATGAWLNEPVLIHPMPVDKLHALQDQIAKTIPGLEFTIRPMVISHWS